MPSQLLNECIRHLNQHGLDSAFRNHFGQVKSHLLASDETACDLVALTAQDDTTSGSASHLLGLLLDEASMGLENDAEHAEHFLDELETAVLTGVTAGTIRQENLMAFAGLYRSAGLPVPQSVILDPATVPHPPDMEDFDLSENLESIASEVMSIGGSAFELFVSLDTMLAAVPDEIRVGMANHIATMSDAIFERCALFLLMSGSELVQEATIAGFTERLEASGLSPETRNFLPMIRGWFASGPVQSGLDKLNRAAHRKALPVRNPTTGLPIKEIIASITDGAGAQSISVIMSRGSQTVVAMIIIKAGHGIKDGFLTPPDTSDEAEMIISEMRVETGADSISGDTMRVLLEAALADGLENGCLPAPGFLDVIEACNLFDLRPQRLDLPALRTVVDPERKIQDASAQALGRWIYDDVALDLLDPLTDSWFEDTAKTREIVARGRTTHSIETQIWKFLETRRDIWARCFLQTALMLRDGERFREWKTLTASAHGLMEGRALKRIPLMEDIMDLTINVRITR